MLGMNAFWAAEDIFKYMKKHGSSRPETTRAITLEVDYRKTSVWGLGRGIQHMAAKYSWSERHIVLELLEDVPEPNLDHNGQQKNKQNKTKKLKQGQDPQTLEI